MALRAPIEFACPAVVTRAATPHRRHGRDSVTDRDAGDAHADVNDSPGRLVSDRHWRHDGVLIVFNVEVGAAHSGRRDAYHHLPGSGDWVGDLSQFKVPLAKRDFYQCFHSLSSLTRATCPEWAG